MHRCVPDWLMEETSKPFPSFVQPSKHERFPLHQNKSGGQDQELVELLWRNGQVVLQAQNQKKQSVGNNDWKSKMIFDQSAKNECMTVEKSELRWTNQSLAPAEEAAPWLNCTLDDPFEDLCSNFFDEIPTTDVAQVDRPSKEIPGGERSLKQLCVADALNKSQESKFGNPSMNNLNRSQFGSSQSSVLGFTGSPIRSQSAPVMPPPKGQVMSHPKTSTSHLDVIKMTNFSHFSRPTMTCTTNLKLNGEALRDNSKNLVGKSLGKPSATTAVGPNNSEILQNQVQANPPPVSARSTASVSPTARTPPQGLLTTTGEKGHVSGDPPERASSSGASGSTNGKFDKKTTNSHKRKNRDIEESDCQSEGIDYESVDAKKAPQKSASSRRSRAAEVHNLSERRRRDRINEKMKALQELIPHCNKSDKASMLDEAIEYLKSLQLQVQIMWMGGGMAPLMYPGVQHYLSPLTANQVSVPSFYGSMQFPELPLMDQSRNPFLGSNQFPQCSSVNPMQLDKNLQEYYARQFSLQQMQIATQSQRIHEPSGTGSVACDAVTQCNNSSFGKSGQLCTKSGPISDSNNQLSYQYLHL